MDSYTPTKAAERPTSSSSNWSWVDVNESDIKLYNEEILGGKGIYPAKQHARSVAKHLGMEEGLIYLPGLPERTYEDSDQGAHWRQRRYFYYLSGINFPGSVITYNIANDVLMAWIQSPSTGRSVIYNGSSPTIEEVENGYDFDGVSLIEDLKVYVVGFAQSRSGKILLLHDNQGPKDVFGDSRFFNTEFFESFNSNLSRNLFDISSLQPAMDAARAIKSDYELKMIRKANEISAKAHKNVLLSIKNLQNEAEIEAIFTGTCIANQAKEQAYGVIAGSGENASTLHYAANNEPLKDRQLVCLDAGCEWQLYASDVTRTFPMSGKFTKEGQEIYDLVEQMQEECIKMVKPGVNYRDIHLHAHKVAIRGLQKLGLLKGTFKELYDAGAAFAFFPHGLGHYLGLEVHDLGDGGYLLFGFTAKPKDWEHALCQMMTPDGNIPRPASMLKENHVITIEPGIYFNRYALEEVYLKDKQFAKFLNKDLLEKYYPVGGVRIEDDILVTKDSYENITTAPKGKEALKIINEGDEKSNKSTLSLLNPKRWLM